ncbi:MAG TPA: signal peptidase I [Candidatus Dormibacteraeota bacterium]|nr:signal peptidase I [Candidatus Dormibacteraeota bacterium]
MDAMETGATPVGAEQAPAAPTAKVSPATSTSSVARPKSLFADFVESLLITILLALFATTFIVQAFKIPSESMEPTLLVGDHLLVNKFIFEGRGTWYDKLLPYRAIRRGDIVVFKYPFDDHPYYVKRVIGLPGDRIHISNSVVFVNGKKLSEPYVVHDPLMDDPFGEEFPPAADVVPANRLRPEWAARITNYVDDRQLVVPPDHYFVMGDNRDDSWDSRYWGFVDRRAIVGEPILIYWSVRATAADYSDRSLAGSMRDIGSTLEHLSGSTRWDRMLREVH